MSASTLKHPGSLETAAVLTARKGSNSVMAMGACPKPHEGQTHGIGSSVHGSRPWFYGLSGLAQCSSCVV